MKNSQNLEYRAIAVQARAVPEDRVVFLDFQSTEGPIVTIAITGNGLAQFHERVAELLRDHPEIASWSGARRN